MTKVAKRFQKGQTVFYASTNFGSVAKGQIEDRIVYVQLGAVIARTVDACGAKQMSFFDRGADGIFGRTDFATHPAYFNTQEEAFAYLRDSQNVDVIARDVYADDRSSFAALADGSLVILAK
jgi:hypothetical protein